MKKLMLLVILLAGMVLVQEAEADNYIMGIYLPKTEETGDFLNGEDSYKATIETQGVGIEFGETFNVGQLGMLLGLGVSYVKCDASVSYESSYGINYYANASQNFTDVYGKIGVETPVDNLYITGKFGGLFYQTYEGYEKKIKVESHYGFGMLYMFPGDSYSITVAVDNDNLLEWTYGLGLCWKF